MEKEFTKIGVQLPEGYKPSRFEMDGGTLNIYIYKEKTQWDIKELLYK